LTRRSKI
jgi:hypothetical protein